MKLPQQSAGSAARDCCANINIEFPIKGARKPKKKKKNGTEEIVQRCLL